MRNIFADDKIQTRAIELCEAGDVDGARNLLIAWAEATFKSSSKTTTTSISPIHALGDIIILSALTDEIDAATVAACYMEVKNSWYATPLGVMSPSGMVESLRMVEEIYALTGYKMTDRDHRRAIKAINSSILELAGDEDRFVLTHNTFAPTNDNTPGAYVCLGRSSIYEVTAAGVEKVDKSVAPLFAKPPMFTAHVADDNDEKYTDGAAKERFFSLTSLTDDAASAAWGWAMSFITSPKAAHPALFFEAPKGTGKTKTADALTSLFYVEDMKRGVSALKKGGIIDSTRGSAIITIDNLDGISSAFSDELATAVTGITNEKRKLHSDIGDIKEKLRLGLIFTTTATGSLKSDLQDRMLVLPLEKKAKMDEDKLDEAIEEVLPYARRALLHDAAAFLAAPVKAPEDHGQRMGSTANTIHWVDQQRGTDAITVLKGTRAELAESAVPTWVTHLIEDGVEFTDLTQAKAWRAVIEALRARGHEADAKYFESMTKVKAAEKMNDYLSASSAAEFEMRVYRGYKLYSLSILTEGEGIIESSDDDTFTTIDM